MKRPIPSIPQLYRNVRRWTEIMTVLSRYGLASWMSRFNIPFIRDTIAGGNGEAPRKLTPEIRIRMALSELGPTFIKFGQLLSTRPDIVGPELADELSHLQSDATMTSFEDIRATIESEQGKSLEDVFLTFEEVPIASASIGQVHRATLPGGTQVVVKVRHSGIERIIDADLDILSGLAHLANRLDDFRNYQPPVVVAEMGRMMRRELNLEREFRNQQQFRAMFENDQELEVPQPIPELCTERMLTMQYLECTKLRDIHSIGKSQDELDQLARRGANAWLRMIFEEGFYHADPHPGNIVVTPEGKLGLLDFGMVGRISESLRENIEAMLASIVSRDVPMLVTLIKRIGKCPHELNESQFANDVADFVGQYSTQELGKFDMSSALNDFVEIVRRYQIRLPGEASVLIKVLITLEGTGRLLSPGFSLMEVMRPFQRLMMIKRLSPVRQAKKLRRFYLQTEQLVDSLPNRVSSILEQIQSGRFDVHLDHRRLGPSVNRLVVGLMTSAIFIGSAWIVSSNVPPMVLTEFVGKGNGISLLGLTGLIVSFLMSLRLLWAIRKSGNLDQQDN